MTGRGGSATSITVEPATGWSALVHTWQTLDLPDGWKAQIADGSLRATPPPGMLCPCVS
ncbi:MAG TPA: hypothetical protein VJ870_08770 [Amycolatopsis sp.]|nr:hypothetical protein [Amycolatopsis sp.]